MDNISKITAETLQYITVSFQHHADYPPTRPQDNKTQKLLSQGVCGYPQSIDGSLW